MGNVVKLNLKNLKSMCAMDAAHVDSIRHSAYVILALHHAPPPPDSLGRVEYQAEVQEVALFWEAPTDLIVRTYGNHDDATEDGAYAVAAALAFKLRGMRLRGRTQRLTGADYHMRRDEDPEDGIVKLEVSGTRDGDATARLKQKVQQVKDGNLGIPGVAVVVKFSDLRILMEDVPE